MSRKEESRVPESVRSDMMDVFGADIMKDILSNLLSAQVVTRREP
jgi:hypothetical protein